MSSCALSSVKVAVFEIFSATTDINYEVSTLLSVYWTASVTIVHKLHKKGKLH